MVKTRDDKLPWEVVGAKVVVIGDLILDEYLDGSVSRISPEAPVPVHLVQESSSTAGGAANVARNIQLVGGSCSVAGVCGNDSAATKLKSILDEDLVDTRYIEIDNHRPTVRKTRITANHQQLVRIDWEEVTPIDEKLQQALLANLKQLEMDALVVSDYGKGCLPKVFLSKIMSFAKSRSIPVIVDPKGNDYSAYEGASLITPNYKEACEALNLDHSKTWDPENLARRIKSQYGIDNVLVTLGSEGMAGLTSDGKFHRLSAVTREVFDVSGAGDTVVSIMALSMGSNLGFAQSMHLANTAAGCVVEKWGTQPILKEELTRALDLSEERKFGWSSTGRKVHDLTSLKGALDTLKSEGNKVVFTNGCFDLLHAGHISYLEEARAQGNILVLGVNSDESVRRLKGSSRPIIPCAQRMTLLAALECVDFVVSFDQDTPQDLISTLMPDVLVKGADYELKDIVGADTVTDAGGSVKRITFVEGLSTSTIVDRVKSGSGVDLSN